MQSRGAAPVVAVLERRGRFLTADPFFARGRRMNVDKPKSGQRAGAGDLVLVAPSGPRAGHGRVVARIGRPDVARDVLEALMLDRGLRRRFDPLVEREARGAADRAAASDDARRDLRAAADVHHRPAERARLRRRDQRRAARRRGGPRLGPHRRRRRPRPCGVGGRPRGLPAGDERLRPRQGRADAARGALERGLLARPAPGPPRGHGRARPGRRACRPHRLPPQPDPLGRAARLPARGPDLRRRGAGGGAMGGAARGRAGGGRRASGRARGPRRARRRVGRAGVRLLARGPRHRAGAERADRISSRHRAPDDRGQRGGRDAARHAQTAGAVPRPRPAGARPRRASRRTARRPRRADAAAPGPDVAAAGGRRGRGDVADGRRARAAHRPRAPGAHLARPAVAQAGALRGAQQRPPRAPVRPLLPLHLADPALPGPDLPPRAAGRDRGGGGGAGRVGDGGRRASGARPASATRP